MTRTPPPHDLDAERAVLSAVLLKPALVDELAPLLNAADFYAPLHAAVWRAIGDLRTGGQPVDPVTVAGRLSGAHHAPASALVALVDATPALAHVEAHAARVRDLGHARRVIAACHEVAAEGYAGGEPSAYLERAAGKLGRVTERRTTGRLVTLASSLGDAFALLRAAEGKGGVTGVSTGFRHLDQTTSGMHPGELWVVAGRPGMGKSALIGAFAVAAALDTTQASQAGSLVVSLEMPHGQVSTRMACAEAGVGVQDARAGRLRPLDWQALTQAASWLAALPVAYYDNPSATLTDIASLARQARRQLARPRPAGERAARLALVGLDYLQLVAADEKARPAPREQQVADVSRGLKRLAKELGLTVVALAQLNRKCEERADKRPMLSDLRESGQLEQDADVVLFLYRDDYYHRDDADEPGVAEVIVAKQRDGPTGTVKLGFDDKYTRFRDLTLSDLHTPGKAAAQ